MDKLNQFYEVIRKEMAVTLATAADGNVTMRLVSPVFYNGSVLIFTHPGSLKYKQLKANPSCCVSAGAFFAEATAEFLGATMLEENWKLRDAYSEKFNGAFSEGVEFGGRDAEFILLKPNRLKGWGFKDGVATEDGVPNEPFDIRL